MSWEIYLWQKITANNRSHFTFNTGETKSWKSISEASQWFCDDKNSIFVNATKPWIQSHAPSVCFKFSAFCIYKIRRYYKMYVSYLPPLHNDLVTNNFNAASAELEFKDHFSEIWNTLKPQQRKWYSIKSAPCGGLIKNLYWVTDTRVVINPGKIVGLAILCLQFFSAWCRKGVAFYQHQSAKSDAATHSNRCIKLLTQIPPAIHWTQTPSYVTTF